MAELPPTLVGLQRAIAEDRLSVDRALRLQRERADGLAKRWGGVVSMPAQGLGEAQTDGVLRGVALAHKDIFDTVSYRPGLGRDAGAVAPGCRDARVLQRLHDAGAVHLARLAMAEHACGATGINPLLPPCANPWNDDAVVGGSSSGSGVAVACGLAYGALGTDTAGSVRIPAAACGVLGLKTTHGLVSLEGVGPLAPSLDTVGLLTRSAADAAVLLGIVSEQPLHARPAASLKAKAWLPSAMSPVVATVCREFVLAACGADIQSELPEVQVLTELAEILMHFEAAQVHRHALMQRESSAAVEAVALPGLLIAPEWGEAVRRERMAQLRCFVAAHLQAHDILLLPAFAFPVPDVAQVTPGDPRFEVKRVLDLYRLMGFVNYLGLPAVVFPIGVDDRGLPISIQAIARPFEDATLLAWVEQHERRLFGTEGFPIPVTPTF